MKKLLFLVAAVLCFGQSSLWAADAKKSDNVNGSIFGGFSVAHLGGAAPVTPLGWQAALAVKGNNTLSFVGDFGGEYKSGTSYYSFLGGARVGKTSNKGSAFAHALVGGTTQTSGTSFTSLTLGFGGGIDVKTGDKVSLRLIQVDWLPSKNSGVWTKEVTRYGFGFVYKLGK